MSQPESPVEFSIDLPTTAEVIKINGARMRDQGFDNYDEEWWNPDNIDGILEEYALEEEGVVGTIDGVPAIGAILQRHDHNSLDDYWVPAHEDPEAPVEPKNAHYIYYVSGNPAFAGRGLATKILDASAKIAQDAGSDVLRLDAKQPNVRRIYERYGFKLVHSVGETGLYELVLPSSAVKAEQPKR